MEAVSRAKTKKKRTRIAEGEDDHRGEDHISRLPDAVLGEIVSLLPTKDGGRTQAIATGWRNLWRSAPLNLDLHNRHPSQYYYHRHDLYLEDDDQPLPYNITLAQITGILSSHPGPGRRFAVPSEYFERDACPAATLEGWLSSPALDSLQELDFNYGYSCYQRQDEMWVNRRERPPLPKSVAGRFSSTLRVASFGGCVFTDEIGNSLQLPLVEQLSLMKVKISETSLNALLAGCPVLQSLMLTESVGFVKSIRIVSKTLRSIGVRVCSGKIMIDQIVIEDAPSLERFLLFGYTQHSFFHTEMAISVISAPKLKILGQLQCPGGPKMEFGNTVFKGSSVVNSTTVLPCVKVLALTHISLSLDEVIAFMKCFPCLENLYIKIATAYAYHQGVKPKVTNTWRQKYRSLSGTLDIRLKKIVLSTYLGNKAHVNFATFFVLNARVLESMVLKTDVSKYHNKEWIGNQKKLLQIEERASRGAQIEFVYHFDRPNPSDYIWYDQTHDLSTADPFVGFDYWATNY